MDLFQRIKNDILLSKLPKGIPLRQVELSELYCVSRIPIRDALLTLKAEGWLVPHGKAGVMIPELSWREAEDIYLIRSHLESMIFDIAFDYIGSKELSKARDFLAKLRNSVDMLESGKLNWSFHRVLYQTAERPTLLQVIESLNKQVARYLAYQYGPLGYQEKSDSQHEKLLSLIEEHDKKAAMILLKQHIEDAGALLVNHLKRVL